MSEAPKRKQIKRKVVTNLRLEPAIREAAILVAKAERRTLTNLIEVLLEEHCRRHARQSRP